MVAAAWGLAEATLFFVVPDVWLGRIALRSLPAALVACAWALAGALAGGVAVAWLVRAGHGPALLEVYERLPAISGDMVAGVRASLLRDGWPAILAGGFGGVPYKLFAAQALDAGIGWPMLLVATVLARGLRFVAVVLLVHAGARLLLRGASQRTRHCVYWLAWAAFYALYWCLMPG